MKKKKFEIAIMNSIFLQFELLNFKPWNWSILLVSFTAHGGPVPRWTIKGGYEQGSWWGGESEGLQDPGGGSIMQKITQKKTSVNTAVASPGHTEAEPVRLRSSASGQAIGAGFPNIKN
jgi:hypothetical protein